MKPVMVVFLGLFVAVGLAAAAWGLVVLRRAAASGSWPGVEGRITRSEVVTKSGDDGPTYAPDVAYVYTVNGAEHTASRIFIGDSGLSAGNVDYANGYRDRYPVGKAVTVHFDPDDAASAVLEPGVTKRSFITLTFGLGFAMFGGWFGLLFWLFE